MHRSFPVRAAFVTAVLAGALSVVTTLSHAEEVEQGPPQLPADYRHEAMLLPAKPARVTVFSDRAEVTRVADVKVHAGVQWLHFAGLPINLDRGTIRVSTGSGRPGKIAQVVIEEVFEFAGLPLDLKAKVAALRADYALMLDLTYQRRVLERQNRFIQGLRYDAPFKKDPPSPLYRGFSAKIDLLKSSMDEIQSQSGETITKLQTLSLKIKEVSDRIERGQNEIKGATRVDEQKWSAHVYVLLESPEAKTIPVELSYMAPNALWHPLYDVRAELNRESGTADIKLVTAGLVEQHTGEDWRDVKLTLSTADPVTLFLPKLNRWSFSETRTEAPEPAPAGRMKMKALSEARNRPMGFGGARQAADALNSVAGKPAAPAVAAIGGAGIAASMGSLGAKSARPQKMALMRDSRKDEAAAPPAESEAGDGDAESVSSPGATDKASAFYTLTPLDELYPDLATATQTIATMSTAQAQARFVDPSAKPAAPAAISYSDSTLPAVQSGGRIVELPSPFPVNLKNDAPAYKVAVHSQALKAALSYFAVPKKDARVFLRAKTTNTTERPILSGGAQVFMDGDLVSKTSLGTVSEGGFFNVDLGIDRNVETKRVVTRKSSDKGLIMKAHTTEVEVKIEIANHHGFPITLEVLDNYPLAPSDVIKSKLGSVEPAAKDSAHGILRWELPLAAKEKKTLTFHYEVSHPEKYIVSEFD